MVIHTMYKRKIKHYNHIFNDTVRLYVELWITLSLYAWTTGQRLLPYRRNWKGRLTWNP